MMEMKTLCDGCKSAIALNATAFICSYECTFCQACTEAMNHLCPNCGGELVKRPRRTI